MNYRDYKRVRIWDSSNPLAEEYVRACSFSQRVQYATIDSADSFVNCKDYTHTGYKALSQSTQLLFNDICNGQQLYQRFRVYDIKIILTRSNQLLYSIWTI
jgi:hypothetical protein